MNFYDNWVWSLETCMYLGIHMFSSQNLYPGTNSFQTIDLWWNHKGALHHTQNLIPYFTKEKKFLIKSEAKSLHECSYRKEYRSNNCSKSNNIFWKCGAHGPSFLWGSICKICRALQPENKKWEKRKHRNMHKNKFQISLIALLNCNIRSKYK